MNTEQIDQIQTAIAALDNQISQVQNALNSPSTTGEQVLALRATLIQLQAQRSTLMSTLIDLQASQTQGEPLTAAAAVSAAQAADAEALHQNLKSSITDNTLVTATLNQANAVKANVTRLQAHLAAAAKPRTQTAG